MNRQLSYASKSNFPVNIHLLFSPDNPNHVEEIERILGHLEFEFQGRTYKCTESDLVSLGRAFDPKQSDDRGALRVGATQFKTTLSGLQNLFRKEEWIRKNCLVRRETARLCRGSSKSLTEIGVHRGNSQT